MIEVYQTRPWARGVLFWGIRMWGWKFWLPPDSQTTDEPNVKPIFKPNFLFYLPINKILYKFNHFLQSILKLKAKMKKKKKKKNIYNPLIQEK